MKVPCTTPAADGAAASGVLGRALVAAALYAVAAAPFAQPPSEQQPGLQPEPSQSEPQSEQQPAQQPEPQPAPPRSDLLFYDRPWPIAPDQFPPPPPPPEPSGSLQYMQREQTIEEYSDALQRAQTGGDAWSNRLAEQLLSLGDLQRQQGRHAEAAASFSHALHVGRVNSGLHSLGQLSTLEKLIGSHIALGDWQQADLYQDYLYYLQYKALGSDDPGLVPVLQRLADWNLLIFYIGYGEARGARLLRAQNYYRYAASLVEEHHGKADPRFAALQQGVAGAAYLASRNRSLMEELDRSQHRGAQSDIRHRIEGMRDVVRQGFDAGEKALQEVVDYYEAEYEAGHEAEPESRQESEPAPQPAPGPDTAPRLAAALTDLADWYLLFERRRTAAEHYGRAWEVLEGAADGGAEARQALFGQVELLPAFMPDSETFHLGEPSIMEGAGEGGSGLRYGYADLMFNVTADGGVRDVQLLSPASAVDSRQLERLRRVVRRSHFRPLVADGRLQDSEAHRFRYRYWY